jgi:hypothetical protein
MEPTTPRTSYRLASEAGIELSNVLGELGDSLSSIILSTLTDKYAEVQSSCLALAGQTNTVPSSSFSLHWSAATRVAQLTAKILHACACVR